MKMIFVIPNTWNVLNETPGHQGEILFFLHPNPRAYSACKRISDEHNQAVFQIYELPTFIPSLVSISKSKTPKTEFQECTKVLRFMPMRADLKSLTGHLQQTWFPPAQRRSSCEPQLLSASPWLSPDKNKALLWQTGTASAGWGHRAGFGQLLWAASHRRQPHGDNFTQLSPKLRDCNDFWEER